MSLLGRLRFIFKAKVSKGLDRAENTDEILDYSYERQRELLRNLKRSIADVVTAKKRLELQQSVLERRVVTLDGQARAALSQNREDLARAALERKSAAQQQLDSLGEQVTQLEGQQQKLVDSNAALTARLQRFKNEKEIIKAQYSAAKAQVRILEAVSGVGKDLDGVGLAVDRAREKTQGLMARANAIEELTAAGTLDDFASPGDHIERELAALSSASQVGADLERLKAELAAGEPGPAALPAGDAP